MLSQTIFLPGEYKTGAEVRRDNIAAAKTLAGIVRTTLGPTGLDKMLIDRVGEVTVTNDGATILQKLDVEHPAAKILVELSTLQDREVGDGTTSVVIYAAELLKLAEDLTLQKVHPTKIIDGYQLALRRALNYIEKRLRIESSALTREDLIRVAQTSMSSKIIGLMPDHFSGMIVDAVTSVKHTLDNGDVKYPIKAIGILKVHGGSLRDSELIPGFALNMSRASLQMPASITDARIALIDFNLQQQRLAVGTQVLIKDVSQMEGVRQMENDITKSRIDLLIAAGVNVILSAGSIDEMAQKYLVEAGVFGARRIPLDDLKRIAKVVGGEIISSLADLDGGETLPQNAIGHAETVVEERLADDSVIFIKGGRGRRTGSIVLRGPTLHMIDEVGRSVHDALCAVSKALECGSVVAGGGSVETALSTYLEELSRTIQGKEQLAVAAFGRALLAIPRQLAVNAALDATELVAKLRSAHARAQLKETPQEEKDDLRHYGLDIQGGGVRNNARAGVLEPTTNKVRSLSFAVEAAVTILRIDDSIRLSPEKPPEYDGPP